MPKNIPSILIFVEVNSDVVVDLAKVVEHYTNVENKNLSVASVNFGNPFINLNVGYISNQSIKFFADQLDPIVESSKPTHPFYWFKRIYEFYQKPQNDEVTLKDAIKILQAPILNPLRESRLKLIKLIAEIKVEAVIRKMESDLRQISEQINVLEEMPSQLIAIAKEYGSIADRSPRTSLAS